jgi:hypothetical protein
MTFASSVYREIGSRPVTTICLACAPPDHDAARATPGPPVMVLPRYLTEQTLTFALRMPWARSGPLLQGRDSGLPG